jgi:hypothetical protein
MIDQTKEYICCAAIWYEDMPTNRLLPTNIKNGIVICGHRHGHCIADFKYLTGKKTVGTDCGEFQQGFLTSLNRFVTREEAAEIALLQGQFKDDFEKAEVERSHYLFSESIY